MLAYVLYTIYFLFIINNSASKVLIWIYFHEAMHQEVELIVGPILVRASVCSCVCSLYLPVFSAVPPHF